MDFASCKRFVGVTTEVEPQGMVFPSRKSCVSHQKSRRKVDFHIVVALKREPIEMERWYTELCWLYCKNFRKTWLPTHKAILSQHVADHPWFKFSIARRFRSFVLPSRAAIFHHYRRKFRSLPSDYTESCCPTAVDRRCERQRNMTAQIQANRKHRKRRREKTWSHMAETKTTKERQKKTTQTQSDY